MATAEKNWEEYALFAKEKADGNEFEEAIAHYEKAIELGCNLPWVYIKLGDVYGEVGKFELAMERIEEAIALDEQNVWGYVAAAQVLRKEGKIEEALEQCEVGLGVSPGQKDLELLKRSLQEEPTGEWLESAIWAQEKAEVGNNEEAIRLYEQAINLNPDEAWPYIKLAELVNPDQKLNLYKAAINVELTNPWGYIGTITLLKKKGKIEEALKFCEEGLKVNSIGSVNNFEDQYEILKLLKAELQEFLLKNIDENSIESSSFTQTIKLKASADIVSSENTISKNGKQVDNNYQKTTIFLFPDYRITNPYQKLLYKILPPNCSLETGDINLALQTIKDREEQNHRIVFHLHWTSPILARSETLEEAIDKKNKFLEKLFNFLLKGGSFIWTIHNVMPHNSDYPTVELELRQAIFAAANKLHIHSEKSISEIEAAFPLPRNKIDIIHHGNYINCYPNYVTREQARKRFDFQERDLVFLFLGQIRPYKGIDELISAFIEIQKTFPQAHLLIAGNPVHPLKKGDVAAKVKIIPNVTVEEGAIPDAELQWYFQAADVVVLPYRKILTSGSVLNALSFSRPVIAPRVGMIEEVVQEGKNGFLYEIGNVSSLKTAMSKILQVQPKERKQLFAHAFESIQKYTWDNAGYKLLEQIKCPVQTSEITIETETVTCQIWNGREDQAEVGRVAILILNYNLTEDTVKLVTSLEKSSNQNFDLIIIDNDSENISFRELVELFSQYTIIRSPQNLGYAGGNNLGIKYAFEKKFDFIWILNPDTHVEQDTLKHLLEGAQRRPDISIYGSTICWSHEPDKVWFGGGVVERTESRLQTYHMYNGQDKSLLPSEVYEVDYVTGASIFCRREIFEDVGLIPERYFLYFEETDWCLGAKEKGHRCAVIPTSVLYHAKRSQTGVLPTKTYFYYFIRGSVLFMLKYFSQDPSVVEGSIREHFVTPWLSKIETRSPKQAGYFAALAQQAIEDGLTGKTGVVDLQLVFLKSDNQDVEAENPIVGNLEINEDKISGWFWNKTQPLERLNVKISIDSQTQDTLLAEKYLEELQQQGFGDGNYGFEIKTPSKLFDGQSHTVEVAVASLKLVETVEFPERPPAYKGRIDGINDQRKLNGWVLDLNHQEHPVKVEVLDGTQVVLATEWNQVRPDLVKAGFETENAGFSCAIPVAYCDGQKHKLSLRIAETQEIIYERAVMMPTEKYPKVNVSSLEEFWQWLYYYREVSMVHAENRNLTYLQQIETWGSHLSKRFLNREQQHLVSIIMPAYNRAETIRMALESVMAQSYQNWELIIADDGSSDETVGIIQRFIEEYPTQKITLVQLKENRGVSAARNAALAKAQGEIIAYLDSDNTWDINFLLIMVNMLLDYNWAKSAYCGDRIWQYYPGNQTIPGGAEIVAFRMGHFNKSVLENKNYIDLNIFVHWRELYETLGGFREDMRRLVDWELIVRYTDSSPPKFVPAFLADYSIGLSHNQITQIENYATNAKAIQQTLGRLGSQQRAYK